MGINVTGEINVQRDDRDVCKGTLVSRETVNGEEMSFFCKVLLAFRKGQKPKNKSKIRITDGFLTFVQFDKEDETTGEKITIKALKIMILSYELLQEGIDEPFKYEPKKKKEAIQNDRNEEQRIFNEIDDDELPF